MMPRESSLEFYARCERERLPTESLLDVTRRKVVEDALAAFDGHEGKTARFLGCSQQYVSSMVTKARERRVEAQLGHPKPIKRGPVPGATTWSHERRARHDARLARLAERKRFGAAEL